MAISIDTDSFVNKSWRCVTRGSTVLYFSGQILGRNLKTVVAEHILNNLEKIFCDERRVEFLLSLNGCFGFVCIHNSNVVAVVDRVSSIPLFYTSLSKTDVVIGAATNTALVNSAIEKSSYDYSAIYEFARAGFCLGNNTFSLKKR